MLALVTRPAAGVAIPGCGVSRKQVFRLADGAAFSQMIRRSGLGGKDLAAIQPCDGAQ